MLNVIFPLEIFTFLSFIFCHVGKRLEKKTKNDFKIYDVTGWTTSNYNLHIVR